MPIGSSNNPYAKTGVINTSGKDFATLKSELNKDAASSGVNRNAELRFSSGKGIFSSGKGIYAKSDTWNKKGGKAFGSNKTERAHKYLDAREAVASAINLTRGSQIHQGKWVGDYIVDKVVKDRVRKEVLREFGVQEYALDRFLRLDQDGLVSALRDWNINVDAFFDKEDPLRENACLRLSDLATMEQELEALDLQDPLPPRGLLEIGKRDFRMGARPGDGKRPEVLIARETDHLIKTAANDIISHHKSMGDESIYHVPDNADKAKKEAGKRELQDYAYEEAKRLLRTGGVKVKMKRVGRNEVPFTADGLSEANVERLRKVLKSKGYEPRFTDALSRSLTLPNVIHDGARRMLEHSENTTNSANQILRACEPYTKDLEKALAPNDLKRAIENIRTLMKGNQDLIRRIKSLSYPDDLGNYERRASLCKQLSDNLEKFDAQIAVLEKLRSAGSGSPELFRHLDATMNAAERLCAEGIHLGCSLRPRVSLAGHQGATPERFDPRLPFLSTGRQSPGLGEHVFSDREKLIDVALGRDLSLPEELLEADAEKGNTLRENLIHVALGRALLLPEGLFEADAKKGNTIAEIVMRYNKGTDSLRANYRDFTKLAEDLARVDQASRSDHLEMIANADALDRVGAYEPIAKNGAQSFLPSSKPLVLSLAHVQSSNRIEAIVNSKEKSDKVDGLSKGEQTQNAPKNDIDEIEESTDEIDKISGNRKTLELIKKSNVEWFREKFASSSNEHVINEAKNSLGPGVRLYKNRLQDLLQENEQITGLVARQKKVLGVVEEDDMQHPSESRNNPKEVTVDAVQAELKALADQRHALLLLGYPMHLRASPKFQDVLQEIDDDAGLFNAENSADEDDDEPHISGIGGNSRVAKVVPDAGNTAPDDTEFEINHSNDVFIFKDVVKAMEHERNQDTHSYDIGPDVRFGTKVHNHFMHTSALLVAGGGITKAAIRDLKILAQNGHIGAALTLGKFYQGEAEYLDGIKTLPDKERRVFEAYGKAAAWLSLASDSGSLEAKGLLAGLFLEGAGVKKNTQLAIALYEEIAPTGVEDACILGELYRRGKKGVPQDDGNAFKWLTIAAKRESPRALFLLSEMYFKGEGVKRDDEEGRKLLRRAAVLDNIDAQYDLGRRYRVGENLQTNYADAVRWLSTAAYRGHSKARRELGDIADAGNRGVEKNEPLAVDLYHLAAEKQDLDATYKLGEAYRTGKKYKGIEQDGAEAKKWLGAFAENQEHEAGKAAWGKVKDLRVSPAPRASESELAYLSDKVATALLPMAYGPAESHGRGKKGDDNLPELKPGSSHFNSHADLAKTGDKEAQYWISKAYFEGGDIEKNTELAMEWLSTYAGQEVILAPSKDENLFDVARGQIPVVLDVEKVIKSITAFNGRIDSILVQEEGLFKVQQFFDALDKELPDNIRHALQRLSMLNENGSKDDIQAAKDDLGALKIQQTEYLNKAYALYHDIQIRNKPASGANEDLRGAAFHAYETALEDYLQTARVTRMILGAAEEEAERVIKARSPQLRGTDLAEWG